MYLAGFFIIFILNKYLAKIDTNEIIMHEYAYTNTLTGLPNDHALDEYLEALIIRKREQNSGFAVINIEIKNFDSVNDTIGYAFGNNVICEIVKRWNIITTPNDYLARKDGMKFVLLVEDFLSEKELLQHIRQFADALKKKITLDGHDAYLSGDFGIAFFPEITNCKDLLQCSDIAMQHAKQSGNTKIRTFENSMRKNVEDEIAIDSLIRLALETDAFHLVFQPQFNSTDKKLRGFETLLRMKDLNGAPISPAVFIPIAEKNGHIIEIDRWVLKHALLKFAPLITKDNCDILISVNISALHILEVCFIDDIRQALDETGFPPQNLEIEITESVMLSSVSDATKPLKTLKDMGIKIALDDFGTGYTSLNYLRKLPVNLLKIDKSFVDEINDTADGKEYIAAIISMGHLLHLSVISEGVEKNAQLETLKELNCDYIQGYLWGKPMDFDSAVQLLP
jgi:polar amino acid transport system substrate-binding protein